jgi:hypothetical protein
MLSGPVTRPDAKRWQRADGRTHRFLERPAIVVQGDCHPWLRGGGKVVRDARVMSLERRGRVGDRR